MTIDTLSPNVFDVAWPTFAYQDAPDPDEAHDIIRRAQQQAPIALGPYGPEVLSYDLVRTVLRDSRFAMPRGISLVVQGISSGPVWDKVCQTLMSAKPAQHRRLRRLVSRAFTPRAAERMRGACVDVINELIDRHSAAGHCDMVHDIARQYPVLIICALLRAPASVNSTRKRLPDFTARNLTPATDTWRRATQAQLDALTPGRSPGSARCGPPITSVHSAPAAPVGSGK